MMVCVHGSVQNEFGMSLGMDKGRAGGKYVFRGLRIG